MKKIFTFFMMASALTANAQQLDNSNFDGEWEDCLPYIGNGKTGGKQDIEPKSWNIANVAGMSGMGATVIGARLEGGANGSTYAVQLTNKSNPLKSSEIVPAYITLGTPWNTAQGFNASNKDGGTFGGQSFTYRPDAVEFYYKRSSVAGQEAVPANVIAYLWSGSWEQEKVPTSIALGSPVKETMVDRDRNVLGLTLEGCQGGAVTKSGKLIASMQKEITTDASEWTKQVFEFDYKDAEAVPEKINLIFSACDYFDVNRVIKDNSLSVDDIRLVYYHALKSFTVGGQTYEVAEGQTDFDLSDVAFSLGDIEFVKQGVGAEIMTNYDEPSAKMTVTVRGNDYAVNPESKTVYTIQFKNGDAPAPEAGVSYKENLIVSVNGQNSPLTPADITVKDADDKQTCDLTLRNFSLRSIDPSFPDFVNEIHVGNIVLTGVTMTEENGVQTLSTEQTITIQPGDDPNFKPQDWFGPLLGEVPVKLTGTKTADQLTASINIEMMGMKIAVAIGEMTTSFQESLLVTLNGNQGLETPSDIVVYRDLDKAACDLTLKNFILRSIDPSFPDFVQEMPVGTIELKDVKLEALPVSDSLSTEQSIVILPGDKEGSQPTDWLGPMLGEVPVKLTGVIKGDRLDAHIHIEMMGMQIEVAIGKDAETGITDATIVDVKPAKGVYNLNGIRVAEELNNSLPAGVYIVNGKKVIVK